MRKSFERVGGARKKFLKRLAKQPGTSEQCGEQAIAKMNKGQVPDDMVVHHKLPLFRGGTKKMDNLDLIDKSYHSDFNKDLHWYPEGQNPYGLD